MISVFSHDKIDLIASLALFTRTCILAIGIAFIFLYVLGLRRSDHKEKKRKSVRTNKTIRVDEILLTELVKNPKWDGTLGDNGQPSKKSSINKDVSTSMDTPNLRYLNWEPERISTPTSIVGKGQHEPMLAKPKSIPWNVAGLISAGVPPSSAEGVLLLARELGFDIQGRVEPLCDPLTLLRFLNAREGVVVDAALMHRQTCAWREDFGIARVMAAFGTGCEYDTSEGAGGALRGIEAKGWSFRRAPQTETAALAQRVSFFGKLDQADADGAPIVVWRLGAFDLAGVAREVGDTE